MANIDVYIEAGNKKVFACAVDWPGWCRAAKDEEQALDALAAYAERYAVVTSEAGVRFSPRNASLAVVERVKGSATTDFGAPGAVAGADGAPVTRAQAKRYTALVEASWRVLDRVAAGAPASLRKGPRGGGRDRDAIVAHVADAEAAYARKIGVRHKPPVDPAALRADVLDALGRPSDGSPLADKGWPARYAARRIAWHALDHAWEIEDRSAG
jgi:hypothetical protein